MYERADRGDVSPRNWPHYYTS
uniref:Uncharacterized protein n=1 Tax=Arundo donax TaxID=35708 RepID=A0A0A9DPA4_ARUDO